jgi:hypothetical protein
LCQIESVRVVGSKNEGNDEVVYNFVALVK